MKKLDKIFFNSVEEMNECYGIDAELPSKLYSDPIPYEAWVKQINKQDVEVED